MKKNYPDVDVDVEILLVIIFLVFWGLFWLYTGYMMAPAIQCRPAIQSFIYNITVNEDSMRRVMDEYTTTTMPGWP